MRRKIAAGILVVGMGCGRDAPRAPEQAPDLPQVAAPAPFVVFSRGSIVIDRLGVPVRPPVTVGSTPSSATLQSDAPQVVSVDPSGDLIAYQDGTATVRAPATGAELRVSVRTVGALALRPSRVVLLPGEARRLRVVEEGVPAEVPADAVEWTTSDPGVATLFGGQVMAGGRNGKARITARFGGRKAEAVIVVGPETRESR